MAAGADRRVGYILAGASRRNAGVVVSAVTLTEVLRGNRRDTSVHRVLARVQVESVTPESCSARWV